MNDFDWTILTIVVIFAIVAGLFTARKINDYLHEEAERLTNHPMHDPDGPVKETFL